MEYIIKTADNGWLVTWKEEEDEGDEGLIPLLN